MFFTDSGRKEKKSAKPDLGRKKTVYPVHEFHTKVKLFYGQQIIAN